MSWTIHSEYQPSTAFGACFKCRAPRRAGERVLDPNLRTDDLPPFIVPGGQDGYMMFCESCITEAAQMMGMLTPLQVAKLTEELADADAEIDLLTARAAAAERALEALRGYDATVKQAAK